MTGLLLDTHVALWWLEDRRLSESAATAIADARNPTHLSIASAWEMAIKQGLGQLQVRDDYVEQLALDGIELLGITPAHTRAVRDLPPHHRDSFDRMLVAQAQVEGLTLVTRDRRLRGYDVAVLEA